MNARHLLNISTKYGLLSHLLKIRVEVERACAERKRRKIVHDGTKKAELRWREEDQLARRKRTGMDIPKHGWTLYDVYTTVIL